MIYYWFVCYNAMCIIPDVCTCVHTNESIVLMGLLSDHCCMAWKVTTLVIQIKRKICLNDNSFIIRRILNSTYRMQFDRMNMVSANCLIQQNKKKSNFKMDVQAGRHCEQVYHLF